MFSKKYLETLRSIISASSVPLLPVCSVTYCLNLNQMLLLLSAGKLTVLPLASIASSSW